MSNNSALGTTCDKLPVAVPDWYGILVVLIFEIFFLFDNISDGNHRGKKDRGQNKYLLGGILPQSNYRAARVPFQKLNEILFSNQHFEIDSDVATQYSCICFKLKYILIKSLKKGVLARPKDNASQLIILLNHTISKTTRSKLGKISRLFV